MLDFPASCWSPKFLDFETNQKKYTKDVISLLEIGHRTSVLNVWVQIPLRSNSLGRWFDKPAVWQRVKREQKIPHRNLISGENDPNKPFTKQQNCQTSAQRNFLSNVFEPRTRTPAINSVPTSLFQTMAGFGSPWPWQTSASSSPLLIL